MCRLLRASLFDAYSRVAVNCGGRLCASRIDLPASRGDEIRCFESDMVVPQQTKLRTKWYGIRKMESERRKERKEAVYAKSSLFR